MRYQVHHFGKAGRFWNSNRSLRQDGSIDAGVSNRGHEFHLHFPPTNKIEKFLQKRRADDFFPMSRKALPIQSGKYESFHGVGRSRQKE